MLVAEERDFWQKLYDQERRKVEALQDNVGRLEDWKYRIKDMTGDEFSNISFWWWHTVLEIIDHEHAAKCVAKGLTANDPDYYSILESDGIEVEIMSPDGDVRLMRMGGYSDFVHTASEVAR